MRSSTCAVLVLTGFATAIAVLPAGGAPRADDACAVAEWPQPRQSACGGGASSDPAGPSPDDVARLVPAWSVGFPTALGDPIVSGGRVFVFSSEPRPRLNAVDLATGRKRWRAIGGRGGFGPIAEADVLVRMSGLNVLRRYDPRSGRIFWRRDVSGFPEGPSTEQVVADGRWYQSKGQEIVAFGARRGELLWRRALSCFGCRVAAAGGRVFAAGSFDTSFPSGPGALHALDGATGDEIWAATGEGGFQGRSSPLLVDESLYVVTTRAGPGNGGAASDTIVTYFVEAFRASDGRHVWHTPVGSSRGYTRMLPAAGSGLVVYESPDGLLQALDAVSGRLLWKAAANTASTPAVGNGLVWIVDGDERLTAFDAADGRVLWRSRRIGGLATGGPRFDTASPVLAGGYVLLGGRDGRLRAWRVPTAAG